MSANPKDRAATNDDRAPLDYLEPVADRQIARVLKTGADKYGQRNFTVEPIRARVYVAAIRRHLDAWLEGEDDAPDTGFSHIAHIGANVHVILAALASGQFIDDRHGTSYDQASTPAEEPESYWEAEKARRKAEKAFPIETAPNGVVYRRTGEVRPPRFGEWYLNPHLDYSPTAVLADQHAENQIIVEVLDR